MNRDTEILLQMGRQCFEIEAEALRATRDALDERFAAVVGLVRATLAAGRKLIFAGVGKNVPICQKLVGTFNSTGAPSCFLDPNQALHGDLGLCQEGDLALLLSNSGETEDLLRLLPPLKRLGVTTLAMTRVADSSLVRHCEHHLLYVTEREACPLNLAPTASTTAALALGDAVAMVCLALRGVTKEDFARYHPAGNLGRTLLLRVADIMRQGDRFASLPESCTIRDALLAVTKARCGIIALTDPATGRLTGVFSDGDFRRASLKDEYILQRRIRDYMTPNPKTIPREVLAVEALKAFERLQVNDLIVVDPEGRPVGHIDGQDLPKLRIV